MKFFNKELKNRKWIVGIFSVIIFIYLLIFFVELENDVRTLKEVDISDIFNFFKIIDLWAYLLIYLFMVYHILIKRYFILWW